MIGFGSFGNTRDGLEGENRRYQAENGVFGDFGFGSLARWGVRIWAEVTGAISERGRVGKMLIMW